MQEHLVGDELHATVLHGGLKLLNVKGTTVASECGLAEGVLDDLSEALEACLQDELDGAVAHEGVCVLRGEVEPEAGVDHGAEAVLGGILKLLNGVKLVDVLSEATLLAAGVLVLDIHGETGLAVEGVLVDAHLELLDDGEGGAGHVVGAHCLGAGVLTCDGGGGVGDEDLLLGGGEGGGVGDIHIIDIGVGDGGVALGSLEAWEGHLEGAAPQKIAGLADLELGVGATKVQVGGLVVKALHNEGGDLLHGLLPHGNIGHHVQEHVNDGNERDEAGTGHCVRWGLVLVQIDKSPFREKTKKIH